MKKNSGIPWIGDIPESWKVCKLKAILEHKLIRNYPDEKVLSLSRKHGVIPRFCYENGEIPFLEDVSRYQLVEKGDLVINKMKAWQGSMAISNLRGIVSPAYHVCSFIDCSVSKQYVELLLRNVIYKAEFLRLSSGIRIKQWEISIKDFMNIPIVLPPVDVQEKIVAFLNKKLVCIDKYIYVVSKSIETLKMYNQADIKEKLCKNINYHNMGCGTNLIDGVPFDSTVCRLKHFVKILDGTHNTPKYIDKSDSTVPLITPKCIVDGIIDENVASHISKQDFSAISSSAKALQYDVIMPMIGTIGNPTICEKDEQLAVKNVILFRLNRDVSKSRFLKSYLNSEIAKEQFKMFNRGGVQQFLSKELVKNLIIVFPSNFRQIGDDLHKRQKLISRLIYLKKSKIKYLNEFKEAIVYEYVTGKKCL